MVIQERVQRVARTSHSSSKSVILERRIVSRQARVAVIGQGYVGFPLAQEVAQAGYTTVGFDLNDAAVDRCNGCSTSSNYHASSDLSELRGSDVIVVAVPTPTKSEQGKWTPDLSFVTSAVHMVAAVLDREERSALVVIESTYAPGTTRDVVAPILEQRFPIESRVFLGYSPERIDPGNTKFSLKNTPKVTSGFGSESARLTQTFYSQFVERSVQASSMEAAEATKILENSFRFVNITFAQEFDEYCERMGIAASEVTDLASTKPFGYMPFYAGAGIGGHCIAEDPYFLYKSMRELESTAEILGAAVRNHELRGNVVVDRIARHLAPLRLSKARILVLGVSYKPGIGDARRSPASPIVDRLAELGASVSYHDSFVPRLGERVSVDLAYARPGEFDLAVVVTKQPDVDVDRLVDLGWNVFDASGSCGSSLRSTGSYSSPSARTRQVRGIEVNA